MQKNKKESKNENVEPTENVEQDETQVTQPNADEEQNEEREFDINEEAEDVHDDPKVTPASSRSAYDEDEEQEGVQCHQM